MESAKVIAIAGHYTQSAVVSVPTQEEDFIFISCGTWSLFGTELKEPVIAKESFELNVSNEGLSLIHILISRLDLLCFVVH